MIRKHIMISEETEEIINNYMIENKCNLSKAVNKIINEKNDNIDILKRIDNLESTITELIKKENITFNLLKQFYSDMGIVGLSNPNECRNLQNFFLRRKKSNDD